MQFTGQKHLHADMPAATKIEYGDEVTEETLQESLRRALGWMSALQAEDVVSLCVESDQSLQNTFMGGVWLHGLIFSPCHIGRSDVN